jgi:hypothetical protein
MAVSGGLAVREKMGRARAIQKIEPLEKIFEFFVDKHV